MAAVITPTTHRIPAPRTAERAHLRAVPDLEVLDGERAEMPRRSLAAGLLVLFVVLGAFTLVNGRGGFADVAGEVQYRPASPTSPTVVVERGDTMWSIARGLQPTGDIRPLVGELLALNGSAQIQPGQVLVLPD